jgi:hypothetical protein
MQLNYTPLTYISDMCNMEPMARALLKNGASTEIATAVSYAPFLLPFVSMEFLILA